MGYEVIPTGIFGDESSQFGIFDGYFFNSGTQRKQLFKLTVFKIFFVLYAVFQQLDNIVLNSTQKSIKRGFGGIGDKGKNRVFQVVVNDFLDLRKQQSS